MADRLLNFKVLDAVNAKLISSIHKKKGVKVLIFKRFIPSIRLVIY